VQALRPDGVEKPTSKSALGISPEGALKPKRSDRVLRELERLIEALFVYGGLDGVCRPDKRKLRDEAIRPL
jgi:hypothetical protein